MSSEMSGKSFRLVHRVFFFVVDLKVELTNKYLNYTTFDQKQTHKSYKAKTNAPD